jgi:hypothetical protein
VFLPGFFGCWQAFLDWPILRARIYESEEPMTPDIVAQGIALFFFRFIIYFGGGVLLVGLVWFVLGHHYESQDRQNLNRRVEEQHQAARENAPVRLSPQISADCTPVIPRGAPALREISLRS